MTRGDLLCVGDIVRLRGADDEITITHTENGSAFGTYTKGELTDARGMFPAKAERPAWVKVCPSCEMQEADQ